jgi:glycosyltransferase involved in cell wall biosynthesis
MLNITWLDAFHGGSHAAVARGYAAHSGHRVSLLTLPIAGGWRWRMRGGAVSLARLIREQPRPDLIVATDMLDLATFRGLSSDWLAGVPMAIYFHENQLTYPLPEGRSRDLSYGWVNYTSALAADRVIFNSAFHRRAFLAALPNLLGRYHDYHELDMIKAIERKAIVLPPGIVLPPIYEERQASTPPSILWNSRWEYDKQPERFFAALEQLEHEGIAFRLIVAGEHIDPNNPEFVAARQRWAAHIDHWGYAPSREAYVALLQQADIVVSTAAQEFFGIGVIEAIACGCVPILPARLTYPELLPEAYYGDCLYQHDDDLGHHLVGAIRQLDRLRQYDWRAIAAPYGWARMGPEYDLVFANLG